MGATSGAGTATLPEHSSSPPVYSGVCVVRSLDFCVMFVDRCLSPCRLSFWSLYCVLLRFTASDFHLYLQTFVFSY
jgi:hypothetical protein